MLEVEMSYYTNDKMHVVCICHLEKQSALHVDSIKVENVITRLMGWGTFMYNQQILLDIRALVAGKHLLEEIKPWLKMSDNVKKLLSEVEAYFNTPTQQTLYDTSDLNANTILDFVKQTPYGMKDNKSYQLDIPIKALQYDRFLIYWSTGLGKTYALGLMLSYLRKHNPNPKYIICSSTPGAKNVIDTLKGIIDFDVSKTATMQNAEQVHAFEKERAGKDILVFSYSAYKTFIKEPKNAAYIRKNFKELKLFLDEVQGVNNTKSKQSSDIFTLVNHSQRVYMFSATPFDNPTKMYSIMKLLDPRSVYELGVVHWSHIYADSSEKLGRWVIDQNTWRHDLLQQRFKLIANAIDQKDYDNVDLPDQKIMLLKFGLTDIQTEIYHSAINDLMAACSSDKDTPAVFIRSLGILANPNDLLTKEDVAPYISEKTRTLIANFNVLSSPKFMATKMLLDKCQGKKPIVWYAHPSIGKLAKPWLESLGKKVYYIETEIKAENRNDILNAFIAEPDNDAVLLTSLYITTTSVTLNCSKVMIFMDHVFKFEDRTQALGRNHRIGQDQVTTVYDLYYTDTVDMAYYSRDTAKEDYVKEYSVKGKLTYSKLKDILNGRI